VRNIKSDILFYKDRDKIGTSINSNKASSWASTKNVFTFEIPTASL
jgi:hypothetical protein